MDNYTTKSDGIPSTFLIHARAISAWGNSVGMTPIQKAIHLHVASMLSTNEECWTSISGMAKQIGATRRGCQYAVSSGKQFFDHEGHDEKASDPAHAKRLWKLVMPMPTTVELAKFLPGRKAKGLRKDCTDPCERIAQTPAKELHRPVCEMIAHKLRGSGEELRGEELRGALGGGGGNRHHQEEGGSKNNSVEGDMQRKAFDVSSDGYPRAASVALLSEFSRLAKGYANEMVTQAGIKKGSPEWLELFPKDGSATYKPSDADLDYLIPIAETSASQGVEFYKDVSPDIPGWICQQVKLAIGSHIMIRDCLRMSALSGYVSRFVVEEEEQQEDD